MGLPIAPEILPAASSTFERNVCSCRDIIAVSGEYMITIPLRSFLQVHVNLGELEFPDATNPESLLLLLLLILFLLRAPRFLFLLDFPPCPPDVPEFGAGEGFEPADSAPLAFITLGGDILEGFNMMLILVY